MTDDGVRRGEEEMLERLLLHLEQDEEDDRLRELAADVRRGGVSLSDAISVPSYESALAGRVSGFLSWYQTLKPDALAGHVDECRQQIRDLEDRW